MLSADEIAGMRATLLASLPDTGTIQRNTPEDDGQGGHEDAWTTLATTRLRVAPVGRTPQERAIADRVTSESLWTVTLPSGQDVTARDRIAVGGRTFEVVAVLAGSWVLARRVVAVEII